MTNQSRTPTEGDVKAARDFFEERYAEDPMHDWSNADELAVAAMIAQARAEEREACAVLIKAIGLYWKDDGQTQKVYAAEYLTDIIRARGEP